MHVDTSGAPAYPACARSRVGSNVFGRNPQRLRPLPARVYLTRRCRVDARVRRRSSLRFWSMPQSQLPTCAVYVETLRVTHARLNATKGQGFKHAV